MRLYTIPAVLLLSAVVLASCDDENSSGGSSDATVTFRKADIAGADMLALAGGGTATKAEGDVSVGPNALYKVSEDGTMVQVEFTVDVEGAEGEVAETIKAEVILSPNFIFPVGDDWLWLANCLYEVKGGWGNCTLPDGDQRNALSKILNDNWDKYRSHNGAHYLIRKSDGAIFEWTIQAGAPDGMDDGFKQPTFLNGWFHQVGKDLYVVQNGWSYSPYGTCYKLQDDGNTISVVDLFGSNVGCDCIWPGKDYLGAELIYGSTLQYGIVPESSSVPMFLPGSGTDEKNSNTMLLSVGGELYVAYLSTDDFSEVTEIYAIEVSDGSVQLGEKVMELDNCALFFMDKGKTISDGETLSLWWTYTDQVTIFTLNFKEGTVTSRYLPEHYPANEEDYINNVAYVIDGTEGFWECDLSKDRAEYVALDWSSFSEYESRLVPGSITLERFEAASLTLQFSAYLSDGTELKFYTSVVGDERGVIKTTAGNANNAGLVITTMLRLN